MNCTHIRGAHRWGGYRRDDSGDTPRFTRSCRRRACPATETETMKHETLVDMIHDPTTTPSQGRFIFVMARRTNRPVIIAVG